MVFYTEIGESCRGNDQHSRIQSGGRPSVPFGCRPIGNRPLRFNWQVRLSWWRIQSSHENLTLGRILPDGRQPALALDTIAALDAVISLERRTMDVWKSKPSRFTSRTADLRSALLWTNWALDGDWCNGMFTKRFHFLKFGAAVVLISIAHSR